MQYAIWLRRAGALGTAGAIAVTAALAVAQEPPRVPAPPAPEREERGRLEVREERRGEAPRDRVIFIAEDDGKVNSIKLGGELTLRGGGKQSEFWVGVECRPIDEALRSQLGLQEAGLVVDQVLPESPAAKAEVKPQDILLAVNDKPLKRVQDLIAVLEESKDKELKFKALRGGKETTIKVSPAKRPEGQAGGERVRDLVVRHFGPEGADMVRQPLRMQFLHPGLVLPPGAPGRNELPDDVSVTVRKEGKKPATVEVKRGDKNWNTTEDKLTDLPDDVRGPLEGFFRGAGQVFNIKLPEPGDVRYTRTRQLEEPQPPRGEGDLPVRRRGEAGDEAVRRVTPPRVEARIVPRPDGDVNARIEQRLQAMAERLSEMNRDLQELRQQRRGSDNAPDRDARPRERDRRERAVEDHRPRDPREGEDRSRGEEGRGEEERGEEHRGEEHRDDRRD